MDISLRKLIIPTLGIILMLVLIITLWMILANKTNKYVMGGYLYNEINAEQDYSMPVSNIDKPNKDSERFQRPSKQPALKLKYVYSHNENYASQSPLNQKTFNSPEDVIQAYFAILKQAENMNGYCGGCGTVGYARTPFPDAYNLLSEEAKQKMPHSVL